jgi:hypothetical protein
MRGSILAVIASCCACAVSDITPTAPVVVTGELVNASGQAVASSPVVLEREPQSLFAGLLAGGSCDPDATYSTFLTGQTGPTGTYDFSLVGSDTQSIGAAADALCFRIRNSQGTLGASVAFDVQVDQVQLPVLQVVDPGLAEANLAATGGSGTVGVLSFTWVEPSPPSDSENLSLLAADGSILWLATSTGQGAMILPGYLAEDATQSAQWEALASSAGDGTEVVLSRTSTLAISPPAVVPLSRGAACSSSLGASGGQGDLPTPCPLTDGKFHDALAGLPISPGWITVDLAAPVTATRAVLRGVSSFGGQLILEGSLDGSSWSQLATASTESSSEYLDIAFAAPVSLQHLKLTATGASDAEQNLIQDLAQVSIF